MLYFIYCIYDICLYINYIQKKPPVLKLSAAGLIGCTCRNFKVPTLVAFIFYHYRYKALSNNHRLKLEVAMLLLFFSISILNF